MTYNLAYQHYKKSAEVDNNVIKSDDRIGEIITNTAEGILCIKWDNAEYETFIKRRDGNYWYIGTDEYRGEKLLTVATGGGLGNQLFQYAYAYFLSKLDCYKDCKISYDTNWYNRINCNRKSLINFFNINSCKRINKSSAINTIICRYATFETQLDENNIPNVYNRRICGYWQNWNFIKNNLNELRKLFIFDMTKYYNFPNCLYMRQYSNIINKQIRSAKIPISIHIRRGDYLNFSDLYYINDEKYIFEAIEKMYSLFDKNDIAFFIFSDDIPWCKMALKNISNCIYVDGNDSEYGALYDITLMSKCKHNIISNSTFSWWAALLNDNVNKTVIAPKNWFKIKDQLTDKVKFGCDGNVVIL